MRSSLSLLMITAWAVVPWARAQTAASQTPPSQAASQPAMSQTVPSRPAAVQPHDAQPAAGIIQRPRGAQPRRSDSRHSPSQSAHAAAKRSAKGDGVLALGATDITGNKELPKVMVIVPWKDSLGAGGVVKPSDSLMDEVLAPVDRGVFQRQVRYYEQLNAAGQRTPAGQPQVAPVGDSR